MSYLSDEPHTILYSKLKWFSNWFSWMLLWTKDKKRCGWYWMSRYVDIIWGDGKKDKKKDKKEYYLKEEMWCERYWMSCYNDIIWGERERTLAISSAHSRCSVHCIIHSLHHCVHQCVNVCINVHHTLCVVCINVLCEYPLNCVH